MNGEFGEAYFSKYYGSGHARPGPYFAGDRPWQALRVSGILRRAGARRILEVGCGPGFFLRRWSGRVQAVGMDVSSFAVKAAAMRAPLRDVVLGDATTVPFKSNAFDAVVAFDVLEHIPSPPSALTEFARLLAENGVLVFSVPNTESVGRAIKGKDWFALRDHTHRSILDFQTWRGFIERTGLQVDNVWYDGMWDTPYFRIVPAAVQAACLKPLAILASFLGSSPRRMGETLFGVAVKRSKK